MELQENQVHGGDGGGEEQEIEGSNIDSESNVEAMDGGDHEEYGIDGGIECIG